MHFLNERLAPQLGLENVRRRLAKIPGKMSETVRELRDEIGLSQGQNKFRVCMDTTILYD